MKKFYEIDFNTKSSIYLVYNKLIEKEFTVSLSIFNIILRILRMLETISMLLDSIITIFWHKIKYYFKSLSLIEIHSLCTIPSIKELILIRISILYYFLSIIYYILSNIL